MMFSAINDQRSANQLKKISKYIEHSTGRYRKTVPDLSGMRNATIPGPTSRILVSRPFRNRVAATSAIRLQGAGKFPGEMPPGEERSSPRAQGDGV
jgi:hypothetical protein